MSETSNGNGGIWKFSTTFLAGIVLTLLGCIYQQDKDRATKADLAPIAASVATTQTQVQTLTEKFNYIEGQLRAKKMIEQ